MAHVGYIRVSTTDQKTARQLDKIRSTLNKIFEEKISAKDTKRPKLQECLNYLRDGDTLHVHSIDRLARNLKDLEQIIEEVNGKNAVIHLHKENLIFSGDESNPMQKLMLQMMGAFAEFERELIRERQAQGIAARQAKGKHFGRPASLTDEQKAEVIADKEAGMTPTQLAKKYSVSRALIYRICPANK